jgi:carboxypeptidase C (cathepsin A)
MYAGALKTSETEDHNLFYWFFRSSQSYAPLVIWLNGGPGSSSMFGLWIENGPLRVKKTGTGKDDYLVTVNPEGSWTEHGNMVFLDQPVGVGFSYGSPILNTMSDGADEFVNFLLAFYNKYPEFKQRKLLITGESYAGKYIPLFATHIQIYNAMNPGRFHIPL